MPDDPTVEMFMDSTGRPCPFDRTQDPTFLALRHVLVLMTRRHFANPSNHGRFLQQHLGCLQWAKTDGEVPDGKSPITIEGTFVDKPGVFDTKFQHSIFVDLGPGQFTRLGLNDDVEMSEDRAVIVKTHQYKGSLIIAHTAPDVHTAYAMRESTTALYIAISDELRKRTTISSVRPAEWGRATRSEKDPSLFRVDLVLEFAAEFSVKLTDESHRIKKVVLATNAGIS